MGDPVSIGLMLASGAASTVGGFMQANAQAKAAHQAAVANNRALEAAYAENARQQEEMIRIGAEQQSDRIREANRELGTLRAASSELGLSSSTPFVVEAAYNEGVDLSRIGKNAQSEIDRISAASKKGFITTAAANTDLRGRAKNARTGAFLNAVDSGLQIGKEFA